MSILSLALRGRAERFPHFRVVGTRASISSAREERETGSCSEMVFASHSDAQVNVFLNLRYSSLGSDLIGVF